jgi:hypothetical protein
MRHVRVCAVLCAFLAGFGNARSAKSSRSPDQRSGPPLTIVLDFRGPYAARSVEEMEREVENILRGAGRPIEWRSWKQATHSVFDELAVVRFDGNCGVPPWPQGPAEDGPLGFTYISDGMVLPFSDIVCERIASSVSTVLRREPAQAEMIFGRAMGRVVAHELVHMILRSAAHSHSGITQPALSENDLTSEGFELSSKDLLRLSVKESR